MKVRLEQSKILQAQAETGGGDKYVKQLWARSVFDETAVEQQAFD